MTEWWHTWGQARNQATLIVTVGPTPLGPDDRIPTGEVVQEVRNLEMFGVDKEMAYLGSLDHDPTDVESEAYQDQIEKLARGHA